LRSFIAPGELSEAEQKPQVPGLTFVSFCLKRNGFASFATKRRKKFTFMDRCNQFYDLNNNGILSGSNMLSARLFIYKPREQACQQYPPQGNLQGRCPDNA